MLLALVEQDAGVEAARYVAQMLVLYPRRTGDQSRFHGPQPRSRRIAAQSASSSTTSPGARRRICPWRRSATGST
jgi:transcriptional regulator GlxA family with amidase domain